MRRICLWVAFCVVWLLLAGPATAQPPSTWAVPGHFDPDPVVAAALEELPFDQRVLLADLASCAQDQTKCASVRGLSSGTLQPILNSLAADGGWRAAAIRELLDPRLFSAGQDRTDADALGRALASAIASPSGPCAHQRQSLRQYIAEQELGREGPVPVFRQEPAAAGREQAPGCLEQLAPSSVIQRFTVVAFFGLDGDDVSVVSGGSEPEYLVVPREASVSLLDRRVFFAVVRRDVNATLRAWRSTLTIPLVRQFFANGDIPLWGSPAHLSCVSIDFDPMVQAVVLVDGARVSREQLYLEPTDHDLTVLQVKDGHPTVAATQSISRSVLEGMTGCVRIRLDLTDSKSVALLGASLDSRCLTAGLQSAQVREQVENYLSREGYSLHDIRAVASAARQIDVIRGELASLGGVPVGADRGRKGTISSLGVGLAELLRQGFSNALSVDVLCVRRGGVGDWDFTVVGETIDLNGIASAPRDPIRGISLADFDHTSSTTVSQDDDLSGAFVSTLSRLYRKAYVRFDEPVYAKVFDGEVSYDLELYFPPAANDQPN